MHMKMIRKRLQQLLFITAGIVTAILAVFVSEPTEAAAYYSGSAQYATGNYIFSRRTQSVSLYGGLGITAGIFNFNFSVPVVYQNSPWLSISGRSMIPSGGPQHSIVKQQQGSMGHTMLIDTTQYDKVGIGDPVFHGEVKILQEAGGWPSLSLTGEVKPPLAKPSNGFGTGEWDWAGGLSLDKQLGPVFSFLSLSYWKLGDMPDLELQDPLVYSVSLGHPLAGGKYALMVSYSGETQVIANTQAPATISLMGGYNASSSTNFGLTVTFGLSNSSPDYDLGLAWQIGL
jgi:hypothetical protein